MSSSRPGGSGHHDGRSTLVRLARGGGSAVGRLTLFLGVAVLCGVLVAAMAVPFIGGIGLAARDSADGFQNLPSDLDTPTLAQRSTILAADGSTLATFYDENRISVDLDRIAPIMRQSIVAIEDSRFYEHGGVDAKGAARALVTNVQSGDIEQGSSTLTMQYVRNVRLEEAGSDTEEQQAARGRNLTRKLQEMRYAIALEQKYSKDQILQGYLNIAYYGDGAHGIEAAAQHYFSVPAAELTLPQAALLAGVVQRPNAFDPALHPAAAKDRRDVVLNRMAQLGVITTAQADAAKATPVQLKLKTTPNGCQATTLAGAGFFCDYVVNFIRNDPAFGKTQAARAALLRQGGLTIRTSIVPAIQRDAVNAVNGHAYKTDRAAISITMVKPGSGDVLAMAINRDFGKGGPTYTSVNYAADRIYGGSNGFQAGSTFKAFTLAAAIQQGIPVSTRIYSPPTIDIGDVSACGGKVLKDEWKPKNSTSGPSDPDMAEGAAFSINTFFAQLEQRTGVCAPTKIATALGVTQANGQPVQQVKAFTLGIDPVSSLTMSEAYATFAARGLHCAARPILAVTLPTGKAMDVGQPKCDQALEPAVADTVNSVLSQVIDGNIKGRIGAKLTLGPNRPSAGKTGTTNGNATVWFAGYTPDLAAAVSVGDPRGAVGHGLVDVTIGGTHYKEAFGSLVPGPIWHDAMTAALANSPATPFTAPDPTQIKGLQVSVPRVSGLSVPAAVQQLTAAGLVPQVSDDEVGSSLEAGSVAYTYPRSNSTVDSGSTVQVYVSNGVPVVRVPRRSSSSPAPSSGGAPVGGGDDGTDGGGTTDDTATAPVAPVARASAVPGATTTRSPAPVVTGAPVAP